MCVRQADFPLTKAVSEPGSVHTGQGYQIVRIVPCISTPLMLYSVSLQKPAKTKVVQGFTRRSPPINVPSVRDLPLVKQKLKENKKHEKQRYSFSGTELPLQLYMLSWHWYSRHLASVKFRSGFPRRWPCRVTSRKSDVCKITKNMFAICSTTVRVGPYPSHLLWKLSLMLHRS